jgi:fumarate hydratase, class II
VSKKFRTEKDSIGEIKVPKDALYGAQTARAISNFPISGIQIPKNIIYALVRLKKSCCVANHKLGLLTDEKKNNINKAADMVLSSAYDDQFPVDIFQTGSGTSTNMNVNEVLANIANKYSKEKIHPNDDINKSQSSNDIFPSAIFLSASIQIKKQLIPALEYLTKTITEKQKQVQHIVKTGRTHLMDAMPISMGQELSAWITQLKQSYDIIEYSLRDLQKLAVGGTAVGTGINAPENFSYLVCEDLTYSCEMQIKSSDNFFASLSSLNPILQTSSALKIMATSIMKIANDLRWMNSGPLAGISEITLPALQPGSSIMPGKINPVIPESAMQVAVQVSACDYAITQASQHGSFQLNVMLPLVGYNLTYAIEILTNICFSLSDLAIKDFVVNEDNIKKALDKNPILITALNQKIGYELGAKIVKTAYKLKKPIIEVAKEKTNLSYDELKKYLNPTNLTNSGKNKD